MTVNAGIIVSVAGDELLQFGGCFVKILDMKSNVLDQASRSEGRVPPTDGKIPARIAQYFEYSSG